MSENPAKVYVVLGTTLNKDVSYLETYVFLDKMQAHRFAMKLKHMGVDDLRVVAYKEVNA